MCPFLLIVLLVLAVLLFTLHFIRYPYSDTPFVPTEEQIFIAAAGQFLALAGEEPLIAELLDDALNYAGTPPTAVPFRDAAEFELNQRLGGTGLTGPFSERVAAFTAFAAASAEFSGFSQNDIFLTTLISFKNQL